MSGVYWALVSIASGWILISALCLWWARRRPALRGHAVPVSVLKPLCGLDPSLEANLETFFRQDHRSFELLFGVQGPEDPAIGVVRALMARFPAVRARLIVHNGGTALNPKVRNLQALLPHARHNVVLVSDSNVAAPAHYLREMAQQMAAPGIELVTSLFRVRNPTSLGARLEALEVAGFCASGIATPNVLLGEGFVVGKSMMLRQSTFERLGGFAAFQNVLAEDYLIGRAYSHAGLGVRVVSTPVDNVTGQQSLISMFWRHHRWSVMRLQTAPWAWCIEPLSMPLVVGMAAPLFGVSWSQAFLWAIPATLVRDAVSWIILQGSRGLLSSLPLLPLRDAVHMMTWCLAAVQRRVAWRGTALRVGPGSRVLGAEPVTEPHVERPENAEPVDAPARQVASL